MNCTNKQQETAECEKRGCEGCFYNEREKKENIKKQGVDMEELIIKKIENEIARFNETLEMEDEDNQTLKHYKNNYKIIKEYLEELLVDIKTVINNPVVRKKYDKE